MAKNPFAGRWRIVWMDSWDQDYVDMDGPGHFSFGARGSGSFQFGLVQGEMDCKISKGRVACIEFTWQGFDECDEATGRGQAQIVDGELHGHIFIHFGDDSAFRAVRETTGTRKPTAKRKSD